MSAAIVVTNVLNFIGDISNSNTGKIAASTTGIFVGNVSNFAGNISNSGSISAFRTDIVVDNIATFTGGVSNSGTINAGAFGIFVGCTCGISTFTGGVSNSGTITAGSRDGIVVMNVTNFGGGVSNSGTIAAGQWGVFVGLPTPVFAATSSSFGGGISNSGTITGGAGIGVGATSGSTLTLSTFAGGISNSGTIAAGFQGIFVGAVTGSTVTVSNFSGGISNSGLITAANAGIFVGAGPGSTATISTFAGNISNSGTITGNTGIVIGAGVTFAAGSDIVNSGTITGTGGTAINLAAATSPITVDVTGGAINGNMVGAGLAAGDTLNFTLASAAATFTYNSNFTNFTTVNINAGTVVLNGTDSAAAINVNNTGTLAGTGTLDPLPTTVVTVNSGGTLAPGTPGGLGTLTIDGSLVFNAGSQYAVQINLGAGNNSKTAVNGSATLAATAR